ncbi:hypothetical protein [Methylobacterium sp. Leaf102]|uniref:hypothetical protein n=1 Tax=Methylobacterium sp. Leaf102 TaxID=1736253 RepID=UPI0012E74547|nr:hypothetical protein [Methylobacterium sp. Leaf102]
MLIENDDDVLVCGRDGTLLRGSAAIGFHAVPCETDAMFSKMVKFSGKIYLSSYATPRGVFVYDGTSVRRVYSGLQPELEDVHTVDAGDDALWAIGSRDMARFDGKTWERIQVPN